jgi:hypothetical protein
MRRLTYFAVIAIVIAACTSEGADETTTTAAAEEAPSTTQAPESEGPAMAPAEVVFEAQTSDGSSITVASVTLPSAGFIAVHANADGGPGPIIGNSELLPAGTTTDVVVTLDEPLAATDMLFPMAHIDVDGDGEYLFAPPDNAVDLPAMDADGNVAVVGAEVTVG